MNLKKWLKMAIKNRVERLEKKHEVSQKRITVFIESLLEDWETGKVWPSDETLSPKQLLAWQDKVRKRIEGEIAKQQAEGGKTCIVVLNVPYGYNEKG